MIKTIQPRLLSFDIEWTPDPMAAEALYGVEDNPPYSIPDAYRRMWKEAGATPEYPRPWVKTMLCRIVTIAGIFREVGTDGVPSLKLVSLPSDPHDPEKCRERVILEAFLKGIGRSKPQLVGFNSGNADVPILAQRAVVNGLPGFGFGERPDKPWEGADYFSTASDFHVDLQQTLGRGQNTPRLHEAATICGIPGKVDVSGDNVWALIELGKVKQVVDYNEFDAFTTHLLWARMAHFSGLLSTPDYEREQKLVRELLDKEIAGGKDHLLRYIAEWDRLRAITAKY
ncbi:hypothetical protein [Cerasicoccus arenae]|uniref:Predicted 3'-5' exonuclease PolB-like domain-containing protein n=1 Tax=Cerasicoccus arenae TaxID=424488 RepID=A0A8J3D975_9BACT|nr:hypothetical protein [Cerasicoccus arenae]MBK1857123.1 hypothetical protein [Cerasicoccus arenae]GHB92501.1 hypothetical protein GCM10007047_04550 [Cerasicoccus arenae]